MAGFNVDQEVQQFLSLKRSQYFVVRNFNYFLLREAMEGRFRWPSSWPSHKPKIIFNLTRRIAMRFSSLLMGKAPQVQVPTATVDDDIRLRSQGVEKLCYKFLERSGGAATLSLGAQDGSLLGNTVFKTYIDPESKWPVFKQCIPDYFYPVAASDDYNGELKKVFYVHQMDILEATERYGNLDFKSKMGPNLVGDIYVSKELFNQSSVQKERQVPVLECWTKDDYLLYVGGQVIYNGANPYGFVPFVNIPNIKLTGRVEGFSDVIDVLPVNEELNQLLSHRSYIVRRWLNPTLVWPGAPKDYAQVIQKIIGGGGVIPVRLEAKLSFLAQSAEGPGVSEMLERLRQVALENANMNDLALSGAITGSINTGSSLDRQLLSILSTLEEKHRNWERGLKRLFSQLLELASHEDAVGEYGEAQVNLEGKSANANEPLPLTKETIGDIRDVTLVWPDTLDDTARAGFEMEKYNNGAQSLYTTLERMGVDYPDDEIERIAKEKSDPRLAPKENAALLQAAGPFLPEGPTPQTGEELPPEAFESPEEGLEEETVAPPRRRRRKRGPQPADIDYDAAEEPVLQV